MLGGGLLILGITCVLRATRCSANLQEEPVLNLPYRISALEQVIDETEERVLALEGHWANQAVKQLQTVDFIQDYLKVRDKVEKLEGDRCGYGRFYCSNTCISDLLVCDGDKDCPGGEDEDEVQCEMKINVGTVLKGNRGYGEACALNNITDITVSINDVNRLDWFPSRAQINVLAIIRYEDEKGKPYNVNILGKGYYNFARREFVLLPPPDMVSPKTLTCTFSQYGKESCWAVEQKLASSEVCAQFRMRKQ